MFVNCMYFCLLCAFYVCLYYIMYIVICAYVLCWTKLTHTYNGKTNIYVMGIYAYLSLFFHCMYVQLSGARVF